MGREGWGGVEGMGDCKKYFAKNQNLQGVTYIYTLYKYKQEKCWLLK